ncbi:MAG: hypothetical protein NXI07_09165, partial [bacterium]|nr:hypothetical protein [bacterium]
MNEDTRGIRLSESLIHDIGLLAGPVLAVGMYLYLARFPELGEDGRRLAAIATLMATWWVTEAIPLAATAPAAPPSTASRRRRRRRRPRRGLSHPTSRPAGSGCSRTLPLMVLQSASPSKGASAPADATGSMCASSATGRTPQGLFHKSQNGWGKAGNMGRGNGKGRGHGRDGDRGHQQAAP